MMAKTGQLGRLPIGRYDDGDVELMLVKIIPFISTRVRTLTKYSN